MTYDELVTKIRDYTEVDANVLTPTIVNGFIQDAEFRLLRDVDSCLLYTSPSPRDS